MFLVGRKKNEIANSINLYYIKEMEWRYNNRGKELYSTIIDYLLVANRT